MAVQLLYVWVSPYAMRAELALAFKGVDYEKVPQDLSNKSKLLLESNPVHKKIPVLIHNHKPICESSIIVQYVDEAWPSPEGKNLLPSDPHGRAISRFWADYIEKKVFEALFGIIRKKGDEQKATIDNAMESLATLEEALGRVAEEPPFFGGATIGFVDIILGPFAVWFPTFETIGDFKFPFEEKFPRLHAWVCAFNKSSIGPVLPGAEKVREFAVQVIRKKYA